MSERVRLQPEDRRAVLLDAGAQLFGSLPYEDVRIDEVARLANCSRALLYHYFPNKRALFAAIVDRASDEIIAITAPDPGRPAQAQLADGLLAYFRWAGAHSAQYRTIYRIAAGDSEIAQLMARGPQQQRERILASLPVELRDDPQVQLIVRAWTTFVTSLCLSWLDDDSTVDEGQLTTTSVAMLLSALRAIRA
jgi:AcrR family transcriptional regulator